MTQKKKAFSSSKEIIETYFPEYSLQKKGEQTDRYCPPHPDPGGKLAEEFAANLRKKPDRR